MMLRPLFTLFAVFTLVTGLAYPALVTGVAALVFPEQANGSLRQTGERVFGSRLIGQSFSSPRYFWARPSATTPNPYDARNSTGSNLGPTNPDLRKAVSERIAALRAADPGNDAPVPVDLVTASGSGLDPHISPAAAYFQVGRVARARQLPVARVRALVDAHVERRTLGIFGESRVNVVDLNLATDALGR